MSAGKVQTNRDNVNVLVETTNSSNTHYHSTDKAVDVEKVLSDDEIVNLWRNRDQNNELHLAKDWIGKQKGYAWSNIEDGTLNISCGSIVKYEERGGKDD